LPTAAVIVAVVFAVTRLVVTANVALVAPAPIVTDDGTVALPLLDESETANPPVGAWPVRVTVPVALFPPTTADGVRVSPAGDGAFRVSGAVAVEPFRDAVMDTVLDVETLVVTIENCADVAPSANGTLVGTTALAEFEPRVAEAIPKVAPALRLIVPETVFPPTTLVGVNVIEETVTLGAGK